MLFLKFLVFEIILTNLLRLYIVANAWCVLGRMPKFTDGLEVPKAVLFNYKCDEYILLFAHFLNPFFIIIALFLILYKLKLSKNKIVLDGTVSAFLFVLIAEVLIRFFDFYDYTMFD
ncbi:MAG TPA: hypothetical protein ENJ95_22015 [Bacteroidetes bacterium]|nr:hypothetical protein [Bacteroidota bacterium]